MYFDQCNGSRTWSAPQRVDVVQRRNDVLCHPERLHVRDVRVHLPRRFGIGRVLEDHLDAIDIEFLDVLFDITGRCDQSHGTGGHGLTEALTDVPISTGGKQEAILIEQSPVHGVTGVDVFGNRVVHEVDGSDDGDLPRPHIRFVDDAAHAAPVVAMGVRIDHGRDRQALANVLLEQLPRCANDFLGYQRVKNDPAGLAPDEGYVGEVEAADLVDARNHLVEPVIVVQYGLAV